MPRDGSATRARILATALKLFVERGYDKTSLREVADEVGVTKAALYYHFRTKEDIVRAAFAEFGGDFVAVVAWLESQPPGPERDAGFVDRFLSLMDSGGLVVVQFLQSNPTVAARDHEALSNDVMRRLLTALAGENATVPATLRSILAFVSLMLGTVGVEWFALAGTPRERREAVRALALELLASAR